MAKEKYIRIPTPKWTWWQTGIVIVIIIFAFRIKLNDEIIQLLKGFIKLWLG